MMRLKTIAAIDDEQIRQLSLHNNEGRTLPYMLMVLMEELGEVCEAVQAGDREGAYRELVQVAAVTSSIMESHFAAIGDKMFSEMKQRSLFHLGVDTDLEGKLCERYRGLCEKYHGFQSSGPRT